MSTPGFPFYEPAEVLDQAALSLQDLAVHCHTSTEWVIEHVQTGVFTYDNSEHTGTDDSAHHWRFSSQTLVRARRIAHLEHSFDADPQLAALTTDLIEEVQQLRRQLKALQR